MPACSFLYLRHNIYLLNLALPKIRKIEEEKAQVDRYKQLLLKQRDIMIALTQRLNERDEQIVALQDELDAYVELHLISVVSLSPQFIRIYISNLTLHAVFPFCILISFA